MLRANRTITIEPSFRCGSILCCGHRSFTPFVTISGRTSPGHTQQVFILRCFEREGFPSSNVRSIYANTSSVTEAKQVMGLVLCSSGVFQAWLKGVKRKISLYGQLSVPRPMSFSNAINNGQREAADVDYNS